MEPRCRIELFGEVRLISGDRVVTRFRTRKTAHLLACLALPLGRSRRREALIDRFWPDLDLEAGRVNLSAALSALRRALGPDVAADDILQADRQSVRLNPDAVTTDVLDYEHLLCQAEATEDPFGRSALLERAIDLYQGDLVPDCYEDWILPDQQRWAEQHVDTLLAWSRALEEAGDLPSSLKAANRAAVTDPLREDACERRIRLYAALGRFADARGCYQEFQRRLEQELQDVPSPPLRALSEQLHSDPESVATVTRLPQADLGPLRRGISPSSLESVVGAQFSPPPPALTLLCGRQAELEQLEDYLTSGLSKEGATGGPVPRLVTVTGPGGCGKTRLALEVARRVAPAYEGRVASVQLESIDDPRRVPMALVRALGITCSPEADPVDCVALALREAPALLVLDNLEQLLSDTGPEGARAQLLRLLGRAPALRCLVTSRQALAVDGERELRLAPLSTPSSAGMDCESVALYLDRARSIDPGFALTTANATEVAALCERLEGLPLAIEMAAAWTRVLPLRTVRERLDNGLEELTVRRKDVPERHRSLRAALDWSFDLLEPGLREAFAALSVFRGGWSLPAAEAVLGERALEVLADLVERSLVVVDEQGVRYRYLEAIRRYAEERLRSAGEGEARERHTCFFLQLAEETASRAPGLDPSAWSELRRDYPNLHAALEWLSVTARGEELARTVSALEVFWVEEGHHLKDGIAWADRALAIHPGRDAVRQRVLSTAGWLAFQQGGFGAARGYYEEALSIARDRQDLRGVADACIALARVAAEVGDVEATHRLATECEGMLRDLDDPSATAHGQFALAGVMRTLGETPEEERLLKESATLQRTLGYRRALAETLYALAQLARGRGDTRTAETLWRECVAIDQALGIRGGGALWGLGMLAEDRGDTAEACRWYGMSLRENLAAGNHRGVAEGLLNLASVMLRRSAPEPAARSLGSSLRQRSLTDQAVWQATRKRTALLASELQERLGNDRFEALWREGWGMAPEAAIARALKDLAEAAGAADRG